MVPFASVDEEGQHSVRDFPAITLSRLHTWLALIPSGLAHTEEMRTKLRNMKRLLPLLASGVIIEQIFDFLRESHI